MCGIAGIINFDGRPVERSDLETLNQGLVHRGPDGGGVYCEGNVGLAHRRLAIIDPAGGAQPFFNDDRQVVLTYNGEVYNYREIREELTPHFRFRTESDTEVVLRAYEKWGIECLQRFRGMFAFAVFDANRRKLYLVRDRLGIKPLYYCHLRDRLAFCSELAPLLELGVPREIDPGGVAGYFRYQYVPTPGTIYKDVNKLEPGHFLEADIQRASVAKRQYWDLAPEVIEKAEGDWLDELNTLLDNTVRIYVRSDVPFGAFLSGGVDSSLVTALMAGQLEEPVRTFSIGFYEREHSELPFAAEVSRTAKTRHHEKVVSPELAEDILSTIAVHFGEPFADSSAVPTYYVAREASQHVKMVLSGDGGDELFGGYWSYETAFLDYTNPLHGVLSRLARCLAGCGVVPRVTRWGARHGMDPVQKHRSKRELFDDQSLAELLHPDVADRLPEPSPDWLDPYVDPVTFFQSCDVKTYMLDDILTKVDRMSMANSLEVRVPLLDHKIAELAFSLPLLLKLRRNGLGRKVRTKYLLKKSATRFFPENFLERPKKGFGIPVAEWCRGPLKPVIESGLRDPGNPVFEWVQFERVQAILDDIFAGSNVRVARVWALVMFDMWMKNVHLAR